MEGIMNGKVLASQIKDKVKKDIEVLTSDGVDVGLAIMRAGDDPASRLYYSATLKAGETVGIRTYEYKFGGDVSINEILNAVNRINHDERINGLLILLPLPKRINERRVVNSIVTEKDIDGLGSISVGRLAADESLFQIFSHAAGGNTNNVMTTAGFLPCTPFGVIRLLEYYQIPIKGKHAVVIGKSLAVGRPLSLMLLAKEATVTVCHKATEDLAAYTRQADILCTAAGVRGLIKGDMVKEGAVVVDIGINVSDDGKVTGDVDFGSVAPKASYITPVPGGVGPVTIAMLLENTVKSAASSAALRSPFLMR